MPIDLRIKNSSSGEFIAKNFSTTQVIPSGVDGDIITIVNSDPSKRIRLDALFTRNTPQPDVTITVDGVPFITNGILAVDSTISPGYFNIAESGSSYSSTATGAAATGLSRGVVGYSITVTKTALSTESIYFSFSEEK